MGCTPSKAKVHEGGDQSQNHASSAAPRVSATVERRGLFPQMSMRSEIVAEHVTKGYRHANIADAIRKLLSQQESSEALIDFLKSENSEIYIIFFKRVEDLKHVQQNHFGETCVLMIEEFIIPDVGVSAQLSEQVRKNIIEKCSSKIPLSESSYDIRNAFIAAQKEVTAFLGKDGGIYSRFLDSPQYKSWLEQESRTYGSTTKDAIYKLETQEREESKRIHSPS